MVSTAALIAALQGQYASARQGQGGGSTAGLPGLLASGNGEGGNAINALSSGGISGGGVPGTATTGSSIAGALGGSGGAALSSDSSAQQVNALQDFLKRDGPSDPSGISTGELDNLQGGNARMLGSVMTGNPLALIALLGQAVSGEGSLGQSVGGPDFSVGGTSVEAKTPGFQRDVFSGAPSVSIGREIGGPSDRPERDRSPGPGPNRGTGSLGGR